MQSQTGRLCDHLELSVCVRVRVVVCPFGDNTANVLRTILVPAIGRAVATSCVNIERWWW